MPAHRPDSTRLFSAVSHRIRLGTQIRRALPVALALLIDTFRRGDLFDTVHGDWIQINIFNNNNRLRIFQVQVNPVIRSLFHEDPNVRKALTSAVFGDTLCAW